MSVINGRNVEEKLLKEIKKRNIEWNRNKNVIFQKDGSLVEYRFFLC